ncbi:MAG: glycoside hydrolase family 95 protein [Leeuwenhoekiella sp.]
MTIKLNYLLLLILIILSVNQHKLLAQNSATDYKNTLWYTSPAKDWDNALPVGNGRLGAMVFGDPVHERIQLNEDSMWPGGPEWGNSKGNPQDLAEIREFINSGQVHLADSLIVERFSHKGVTLSHQTMGDLFINYENDSVSDYKRSLDLENAVTTTIFTKNGYQVTQQVFASAPDDVLVVHIETTNPAGIDFDLNLSRPKDHDHPTVNVLAKNQNTLTMRGMVTQYGGAIDSKPVVIDHGVSFETILKSEAKSGKITALDNTLKFEKANQITLYIVCRTSFYHDNFQKNNEETLAKISGKTYQEILKSHEADYQKLYNRTTLDLGHHELDSIATDLRLQRVKDGDEDLDLVAKLFEYGRYLLISSSRPGTNPANLQGIWNEHIEAPWNADYHLNINLQMNYWPAGVANLSELQEPLFDFTDRLIERGKILAREQYGMQGAVIHHTTDLWAAPWMQAETAYWGSWIHGGGWLAQHYWEHFRFTQDTTFLKERAYPALKAFTEFYADWLTENPEDHTLISSPETSPENSYIAADGKPAAVTRGNAMGQQIIAEVFDNTLAAADILGISDDFTNEIKQKRSKLHSGLNIASDGRLMEWDQNYKESEEGHRHISHLYSLYPGDAITSDNPELFEAARKTIQFRLDHGGAGPGWSRAWIINFFARLKDKNSAEENVKLFMQRSLYGNLLDIHPPFQIDGNFGFTAGIAEMLLQSHEGFLRILPALPDSWDTGAVKGLKARGNIEVDIQWKDGKLVSINLLSPISQKVSLLYNEKKIDFNLLSGKMLTLNGMLKQND